MNIYSTLLLGLRWPILIQIERGGIGRWVALFQKWWSTLFQGRCECTGLGKKRFRVYLPNAVPQPHKVLGVLSRICLLHVFPRKQSCAFVFCACALYLFYLWKWDVRVIHLHEGFWSDTESVSSGSSDAPLRHCQCSGLL